MLILPPLKPPVLIFGCAPLLRQDKTRWKKNDHPKRRTVVALSAIARKKCLKEQLWDTLVVLKREC